MRIKKIAKKKFYLNLNVDRDICTAITPQYRRILRWLFHLVI
jgi:hypothetical protein